jgi:hypothetical protein
MKESRTVSTLNSPLAHAMVIQQKRGRWRVLQAKEKVVVNYPTEPSGFFKRTTYEVRLFFAILLSADKNGDRKGIVQHLGPEYMEHLISVTKVAALMPAPEVRLSPIWFSFLFCKAALTWVDDHLRS